MERKKFNIAVLRCCEKSEYELEPYIEIASHIAINQGEALGYLKGDKEDFIDMCETLRDIVKSENIIMILIADPHEICGSVHIIAEQQIGDSKVYMLIREYTYNIMLDMVRVIAQDIINSLKSTNIGDSTIMLHPTTYLIRGMFTQSGGND